MPFTFPEILIIILITLLFAEKYLPAILTRLGLIKRNGNEKNGIEIKLKEIEDNHLHSLDQKLEETVKLQNESLFILKEFKEYGIKIRKK